MDRGEGDGASFGFALSGFLERRVNFDMSMFVEMSPQLPSGYDVAAQFVPATVAVVPAERTAASAPPSPVAPAASLAVLSHRAACRAHRYDPRRSIQPPRLACLARGFVPRSRPPARRHGTGRPRFAAFSVRRADHQGASRRGPCRTSS